MHITLFVNPSNLLVLPHVDPLRLYNKDSFVIYLCSSFEYSSLLVSLKQDGDAKLDWQVQGLLLPM